MSSSLRKLQRIGLTPQRGVMPAPSIFKRGSLRGSERPLVMQFVGLQTVSFAFRTIPTVGTVIPAGMSAWYGLAQWNSPDDFGQQVMLNGYRVELGPTNPGANGDSEYPLPDDVVSFGTEEGTGAAIVIGRNLGIRPGVWAAGPNNIPYVEQVFGVSTTPPQDRVVLHFAPGRLDDLPRPSIFRNAQSTPLAIVLGQGSTLDVALVVRGIQISGQTKPIGVLTRCYGELQLASTQTIGEIQE